MEEVCSLVSKLERKSSKRKSQREKERMKKNQAATEKSHKRRHSRQSIYAGLPRPKSPNIDAQMNPTGTPEISKQKALAKLGVNPVKGVPEFELFRDQTVLERLNERLQKYDLYGLPKAQGLNLAVNVTEVLRLESSWRDFLDEEKLNSTTKSEARFQEAVWEIILTEHNYISKLHSAIHVYIGCLVNLQEDDMFEKVQIKKLFTNLKVIYRTHLDLWTNFFLPELKSCRKDKRVLNASSLIPIYSQIEERIPAVYVNYLVGARDSIEYMRELCDEDELFRRFIDWAEDKDALQPEKNKCKGNDKNALDSILSGPHQRITRYGLLLETVCKLAEEPIKKELDETRVKASALCLWIDRRVSLEDLRRTVTNVEIDDFKNLSETTSDFLANHFAARGAFDFFSPIENVKEEVQRRVYFEDSGIQLKDGEHKNVKIFVVILTDVLLILKSRKDKKKSLVKSPVRTDRIMMLNEGAKDLTVISLDECQFPISVFTLTFDEKRKLQNFQAAIGDAQKELDNLKSGICANPEFIAKLNSKVELLELESANSQITSKRTSRQISSSRNHEHIFRQSSFEQIISNFGNVEVDDGGIWAG